MTMLLLPDKNVDKGHLYQILCSSYKHKSLALLSSCIIAGYLGGANKEISFLLFLQTQSLSSLGKSHNIHKVPLYPKGDTWGALEVSRRPGAG